MYGTDIAQELGTRLESAGLHGALAFLNSRTPHRFTGVYRYDGEVLRNVGLFDRFSPEQARGDDVPMGNAYCALVGNRGRSMMFADARDDPRFEWKPGSPVVSYCGALLRDAQGEPFGTLCHFDVHRCEPNLADLEVLDTVGPLVYGWLSRKAQSSAQPAN